MNIQKLLLLFQLFCCSISPHLTTQQLIAISTLSTTPVFGVGGSLIQIHSYKQIWQCMLFHEACIHVIEYNNKWPPQGKFPVWIQSESWCSPRRKVLFFIFSTHVSTKKCVHKLPTEHFAFSLLFITIVTLSQQTQKFAFLSLKDRSSTISALPKGCVRILYGTKFCFG